jgi:hypothetical protein
MDRPANPFEPSRELLRMSQRGPMIGQTDAFGVSQKRITVAEVKKILPARLICCSASGFRSPQTEAVHAKLSIVWSKGHVVVRIFALDHPRISDPVHNIGGVMVLQ